MSRKLIILFLCLLGSISIYAQEIVSGIVVDAKNEPIPGVRVEVVGRSEVTTTDIDGRFRLDLPVPVKKLRFTYLGIDPVEYRVKPDMVVKMGKGWSGRNSGYRGFFDFLGGFGTGGIQNLYFKDRTFTDIGKSSIMFGISMTHGYQINPMFFVGVGAGASALMLYKNESEPNNYYNWSEHSFYGIACQFFADFRWDYNIRAKTSPFVDLKVGLQKVFSTHGFEYGYHSWNGSGNSFTMDGITTTGFLLMPAVGLRTSIGDRCSFNIGLCYNVFVKRAFYAESSTHINLPDGTVPEFKTVNGTFKSTGGNAMLMIGFDF